MKIKVLNISQNELPKYETSGAAGLDVRADFSRIQSPSDIKIFGSGQLLYVNEVNKVTMLALEPGSRALIPTGLHVAIPEGYEIQVRPRSGLALKEGISLVNCVGTIDSDFRGEIGLIMINSGLKTVYIEDKERIGQLILNKVEKIDWDEVFTKESLGNTDRGEGGFNSTGKK